MLENILFSLILICFSIGNIPFLFKLRKEKYAGNLSIITYSAVELGSSAQLALNLIKKSELYVTLSVATIWMFFTLVFLEIAYYKYIYRQSKASQKSFQKPQEGLWEGPGGYFPSQTTQDNPIDMED